MLLFCCGCSYSSHDASDVALLVKKQCVSEETVLAVANAASLSEVKNILGSSTRHEFTVSATDGEYTLISCYVDIGQGISVWFLFRNGTLVKVPAWVPYDMEEIPYEGTTWRRRKSWGIEDTTRVQKVIAARSMTPDQLRTYFASLQPDKRTAGEPENIMPAFLLTGYFKKMGPRIKKDYETNEELRKRYDGCRANLGMSIEQVDELFGKPLRNFSTKDGYPVRIYGEVRRLEVDPQYRFSCVVVVFDAGGRSANIYSHGFVDDAWAL